MTTLLEKQTDAVSAEAVRFTGERLRFWFETP
jgi:hypothetical protein